MQSLRALFAGVIPAMQRPKAQHLSLPAYWSEPGRGSSGDAEMCVHSSWKSFQQGNSVIAEDREHKTTPCAAKLWGMQLWHFAAVQTLGKRARNSESCGCSGLGKGDCSESGKACPCMLTTYWMAGPSRAPWCHLRRSIAGTAASSSSTPCPAQPHAHQGTLHSSTFLLTVSCPRLYSPLSPTKGSGGQTTASTAMISHTGIEQ